MIDIDLRPTPSEMVIPLMSELLEQTENYNQWTNHERPAYSYWVLLFVFDTNCFDFIEKKNIHVVIGPIKATYL